MPISRAQEYDQNSILFGQDKEVVHVDLDPQDGL